ncbi:glycine--tRNA ligase subunit beta [Tateyamaria sp. ANG-S1]|uniref:glycine--tRNA ligase subunit beta n=1 Tax=Tateyamaria sp. ANG-S1 TaxID=1577905 RepID=UPI00057DC4BB|nr:glycine--tRNA ligase subunit beta [Tateyamaria sp. ANG-S1]KIC49163.1 glycyl-tRNA synthetase subunit beta [Tateyamaria sp. ANG-S1]
MPDLLIELFSEEIPARMQKRAGEDLQKLVTNGLVEAGLTYASAAAFTTPRRLTLTVEGLLAESPTTREERKGPKADAPEKAIEGFLRGAGLTRDQVEERETPKGNVLFAVIEKPGRPAAEIIAEVLAQTVRTFPWPKSMRWGSGALKWVRPLHSILCILSDEAGTEVVPGEVDGIAFTDTTEGHRFMAPGRFSVTSFEDYEKKLKRAHVILNAADRSEAIWHDATNAAFASGLEVVEDKGLLAEVAGLVEWPVVLMGKIGDDFLDLPPEVLQTSMKEHQKFFSVRNPKTGRIERFITVANRETADNGATILAGNEKVLSARLADAKFFWENDLRVAKSDMSVWTQALENVTFHNKLGSQADRINRIAALAKELAPIVGADEAQAEEAARLAKADLSSEMVYEFPELQGLMGRYYIGETEKNTAIAAAAQEHYSPLGPSDDVPTAPVSVAVALADKLDTLTGFWAIDEKPTGSKDPFALRRAALGVIRLLLTAQYSFSLRQVIKNSYYGVVWDIYRIPYMISHFVSGAERNQNFWTSGYSGDVENPSLQMNREVLKGKLDAGNLAWEVDVDLHLDRNYQVSPLLTTEQLAADLLSFFHDRLKVYLRDQGIRHDIIDACIAMPQNDDLTLLVKRAKALSETLATDDGENLIQGFKRANNILTQAEEADGVEYSYGADIKFAEEAEEKALFEALDAAEAKIAPAMEAQDFASAMQAMATLRGPIDAFFEAVQINADNQTVRRNRLNLLSRIRALCLSVADLTKIEG